VQADTRRALRADHASRPPTAVVDEVVREAAGDVRWIVSRSAQVAQLRFADRVQGSICLTPTWGDLADAARVEPRLAHLVPADRPLDAPRANSPGTLIASRYGCLFPVPVLLSGSRGRASLSILVLGLGAGAGIALLAHHFPGATITAVEVDTAVAGMARRRYPLLDWLASPGGQLAIVIDEARAYAEASDRARFDVVIVDCSAPEGGPAAQLREPAFFAAIRDGLLRDDGVVAVNVLGSYRANRRSLVECLASLDSAGFVHRRCLPALAQPGPFDPARGTNHLVLGANQAIDPTASSKAWAAASSLELYAGLDLCPVPVVHHVATRHDGVERSSILSADEAAAFAGLAASATPYGSIACVPDSAAERRAVAPRLDVPAGAFVSYERRDLLRYARWVYSASVTEGHRDIHDGIAVASMTGEEDE